MADSPPAPKAILRGHKAQVHAAAFIRHNERLVTGDAEGNVVLWDLTIMRPRAVWRAHENSILGIKGWGEDKIITHGRDHKLIVWKVAEEDEERLSVSLPLEDVSTPRPQPWIVHLLEVNTMNFCSFAACPGSSSSSSSVDKSNPASEIKSASELFIAVPNTLASEAIDIFTLPTQARIYTIKPGQKNGMAMCLSILQLQQGLTLIAAFENGFASVHRMERDGRWTMTYRSQAHSQPVLSMAVHPSQESFITSAADSIIAKHPIPVTLQELSASSKGSSTKQFKEWEHPLKTINTKHSGQQSIQVRSDGKIFATAGWDSKIRVYSVKTMKELAVLSWHKVGAYAVAFATLEEPSLKQNTDTTPPKLQEKDDDGQSPSTSVGTIAIKNIAGDIGSNLISVKDRRLQQAKTAHWIAAGAKDGKVSLWDIY